MVGIPEEEFRSWYSVRDAVEVLKRHGLDTHDARQSILHGVRTDGIRSGAERTDKRSKVPGKKDEDLPFATMRSDHWLLDEPPEAFWNDGTATLRKKGAPDFHYRHFGIRLERAGIDKLAAQRGHGSAQEVVTVAEPSGSLADADPTEAQFARWLRPHEFLALRGSLSAHHAVSAIDVRLRGGLLPAAAGLAKWTNDGERKSAKLTTFPPDWWSRVEYDDPRSQFWVAPVVDVIIESEQTRSAPPIYFFDLRFEPDAARALFGLLPADEPLPAPASTAPPPVSPGTKPIRRVSDARLKAWFETYNVQNPTAVHRVAKVAAEAKFRPQGVGKNQLYRIMRTVRGKLTLGNPAMSRHRSGSTPGS